MVDNLLPDHVGLPHFLDLAVHLVQLTTWMGRVGQLFPQSTPSWLKVIGGVGGVGGEPCDYSVTSSPIGLFTSLGLGWGLGLGGQGLGLGLDN